MLAQVLAGAVIGVDAFIVQVEVDMTPGLPVINVVGLPESAVREGRERVSAALANSGFKVPPRRITVNLAPADTPKSGSAFDLPIAIGLLVAARELLAECTDGVAFIGELGLDGELRPVPGVLPIAARCVAAGLRTMIVPAANAAEAAVVAELEVFGAESLRDVLLHLSGRALLRRQPLSVHGSVASPLAQLDLADVKGQASARRALEIAAAVQHHLLMEGPPGAGKSMLARRLPGILPPLTRAEALDVTRVYSVAGRLRPGQALLADRPFRAPHHTVSEAGLIGGGGGLARPGEVSLAHHGVLFLDELPEFRRSALEALRQPLEDGTVQIGRARGSLEYPARIMLVAAMNPCACGFAGTGEGRCICTPHQVQTYHGRVSGPLLDRFDLHIEVPALSDVNLARKQPGESSADVRERVLEARARQHARFAGAATPVFANSQMGPRELREHCALDAAAESLLRAATRRLRLSARAWHRVLRLARTVADLAGAERITKQHVSESIQYRTLDRAPVLRTQRAS